jgi:hypothetical protein
VSKKKNTRNNGKKKRRKSKKWYLLTANSLVNTLTSKKLKKTWLSNKSKILFIQFCGGASRAKVAIKNGEERTRGVVKGKKIESNGWIDLSKK